MNYLLLRDLKVIIFLIIYTFIFLYRYYILKLLNFSNVLDLQIYYEFIRRILFTYLKY